MLQHNNVALLLMKPKEALNIHDEELPTSPSHSRNQRRVLNLPAPINKRSLPSQGTAGDNVLPNTSEPSTPLPSNLNALIYPPITNPPASNSFSHDFLPSSSGPFTPFNLPDGWTIYPPSSTIAIMPVQIAGLHLHAFYASLVHYCAQNFWSETPGPQLLNSALTTGPFTLTVVCDPNGPGLPWGVLAVLAQGLLDRANRGWTNTWDGEMTGPDSLYYRILLTVKGQHIPDSVYTNLNCDESLPSSSGGSNDDDDEAQSSVPPTKKCKNPQQER
ncbi:MAG: hypothetical protein Q9222_002486 [Ikaeria aurantiellina]